MNNIILFKDINLTILKNEDINGRIIGYSTIKNVIITGRNNYYPNVLLYNNEHLISPYDEKIMSLNKDTFYDNNKFDINLDNKNYNHYNRVFFFIYNFDNYYHFIYDTLPYLYTFLKLKKIYYNLKLLVNYPNKNLNKFYKFNNEFLEKIININDLIIHDNNNIYDNLYISTSLTHSGLSNLPPRIEIYSIYNIIKNNINFNNIDKKYLNIDKVYISRRTWIHNDISNIGTNYTTRRKMVNEDSLVNILKEYGYIEIFAENLNTDEKLYIFNNAKIIIGVIGGGMTNLLFSHKNIKSIILETPHFLDINFRFKYSIEHTYFSYFNDITLYKEDNNIPLFTRVKINDKIGEICDYKNNLYLINLSNNDVAGFNNNNNYEQIWCKENDFIILDKGLNSPYSVNLNMLKNIIKYI